MLEELNKKKSDDPRILAQLITAYSQFDPAKAKPCSKDLPSVEKIALTLDIDVDQLEPSFSTLGPKYMKRADTAPLPGLPKKESSNCREKRRDKSKEIGKGPQGANSGITDSLDASKTPGSDPNSPKPSTATTTSPTASSSVPAAQAPRQQKPAQAQKRKNKGSREENGDSNLYQKIKRIQKCVC
ncbi:signal recognition particle subunit SRP72-like [Saccostrea echinata]|uniref:signal recognition particle subunit SRP72-like n=1 Tax=Saccostrea echinata TaxID=191078 RepID=UPI002A83CFDD|nr:signal recognition particle subunit SRP72-like [Saccostrea echinata]